MLPRTFPLVAALAGSLTLLLSCAPVRALDDNITPPLVGTTVDGSDEVDQFYMWLNRTASRAIWGSSLPTSVHWTDFTSPNVYLLRRRNLWVANHPGAILSICTPMVADLDGATLHVGATTNDYDQY